jgi:hypothetical protein
MGRFISPDDGSDQDPNNPQSWNLYSYVRNNPLNSTDPDGHSVQVCDTYGNCGDPISNAQYEMDQKTNQSGLDEPTLDTVGMSGNGAGQFYATPIYGGSGIAGYATYVWDGDPTDYYANWAGLDRAATNATAVSTKGIVAWFGGSAVGAAMVLAAPLVPAAATAIANSPAAIIAYLEAHGVAATAATAWVLQKMSTGIQPSGLWLAKQAIKYAASCAQRSGCQVPGP